MHLGYLHFLGPEAPGLIHVDEFVRATRALGHRIDVHAMRHGPGRGSSNGQSSRQVSKLRRSASRYLHEPKKVLENLPFSVRQRGMLHKEMPDVVLVRNHTFEASSRWVTRSLGLPHVIEVNAPALESRVYFDQYAHLPVIPEVLEGWKLRRADSLTVVSSSLKSHFVETLEVEPEKVFVNPNGANVESFGRDLPCDSEVTARFDRHVVVGFVGSFQEWHGIGLLSSMMVRLASIHPDIRFLFVGAGPSMSSLQEDAGALGERVLFTGRVDHGRLPGLVSCLDIAVMPESNPYGSPLKVLEWMAAGTSVVAPRYGPLEDIIDSDVHGLLFPPKDLEALVAAVSMLVDNPELRRRLGQAAADRVCRELTWEHNADRALEACRFALRRAAGNRSSTSKDSDGR